MCKPPLVDAVEVVAEMPMDKASAEAVRSTAKETTPTEKAEVQGAEVPVTPRMILSLSSQERPALLVALLLRITSEGAGMVMPLILAEGYNAVVDGLVRDTKPQSCELTGDNQGSRS